MINLYKNIGLTSALALILAVTGCSNLPGTDKQQGAAIGGASGAAVGAIVAGEDKRWLGALLGGALGAGGGYLIGANADKITGKDSDSAKEASESAQRSPATAAQAKNASTADLNSDGFVTMDELVAMEKAGLSDQQIVERMRSSGQVFELTEQQRDYLRQNNVSQSVLDELPQLNEEARQRIAAQTGVIGRPAENAGGSSNLDR